MKILVSIKRVPDYQAKIKVKVDGSGIETDGIKWIINPFDEIAVEEALRLKEAGKATEVIVVLIGSEDCTAQIRYALALGADRGVHVLHNSACDSDLASKAISQVFKNEAAGLLLMGKQAIDSDSGQTAQLCAVRLGIPLASFASKVELDSEKSTAVVVREVDGGLETLKVMVPAVISTDLRLNEPRYATLPGQMKAKKKTVDVVELTTLLTGQEFKARVSVLKMMPPTKRQGGKKVESVAALFSALKNEAKVI
jgi:electron transfer flavoprotein beta subunit